MESPDAFKKSLIRLYEASKTAATRAQTLDNFSHITTNASLLELIAKKLKSRKLIIVSNREPYAHLFKGDQITAIRTAGGLTTALDSIARAFHATWVCHGGANADFKVVDSQNLVSVPPNEKSYFLKRIKLTKLEEQGYYEGFSNETLWPLCHICYIRPKFIQTNWEIYDRVNEKFAQATASIAEPQSIIFLQDYHLARVAFYLKQLRPDLTTALFWHIPWPNSEIFRILPWKKEILEGLLANDILGFHLKYHTENFLETVALELECRINWEKMRIERGDRVTRVNAYPISIDFESIFRQSQTPATVSACKNLIADHRLADQKIILGVDRLDYTKGILERLQAFDRLLDSHPEYIGKIKLIQLGVPSRTGLEDYQQLVSSIENHCVALNARYAQDDWEPILFMKGHQNFDALLPFYYLAHVCVVSSLHDGMNLVAKEFIATSSQYQGVLVLSAFTGAARELEDALLINPYDIHAFAETLHRALSMPLEEQKLRITRMQTIVAENNIFTWAQNILQDILFQAEQTPIEKKESSS